MRVRTATVRALLFLGTILLFSRVTRYGFINYDDPSYVTNNPHVQGGLSREGIVWAFVGGERLERNLGAGIACQSNFRPRRRGA